MAGRERGWVMALRFLWVIIWFVFSFAGVTAWAQDASMVDGIGINEAVQRALEHDVAAKIAGLNLESARITYQRNMAVNLLNDSSYNRRSAEANLRTAEITYTQRKADVAINAVNRYFAVLSRELGVEIAKAQREVARIHLDSTVRKADLGTAGRLDVLDARADLGAVELNLAQAIHNLNQEKEAFATMLGMSSESFPPLMSRPELTAFSVDAIDPEQAIAQALEHSSALVGAQSALELAQMELEQAVAEGVAPLDQQAAELRVRVAELELEQAERNVRLSVISAYEDWVRAQESMEVEAIQMILAEERHQLVRQQFEVGLRTQSELISADITLTQARQRELTARSNYYNAVLAFLKLTGASFGDD